ncbi:hypothetical protein VMT65_05090 [Nocardia sp. CDC153]|uniref:hypothetical protein n=1 Tax=Nocardia sp. CDC153 TaxID=3112167 RepID=UPI002DBFF179|nr:hypothetical protein [Nocardia sp. CDC153]MEC3952405.1 hypothetical protein [Nocardia sp. CDC153]
MTGAAKLLAKVARASVPERETEIAREARRLAGSGALGPVLADLSAGGWYERRTAVRMATIGGDRDYLLRQLDSPDRATATRALTGLIRLGVEPKIVSDRLPQLSQLERTSVWRALARFGNTVLADEIQSTVRSLFGEAESARILPYCSAAVVARELESVAYAVNWAVLGRRHIDVVFDHVEARIGSADREEWRELWHALTANVAAAARYPSRLLAVAGQAVEWLSVTALTPVIGALARHDAEAVAGLILHGSGHGRGLGGTTLWRAMLPLSDDRLREIYEICPPNERRRLLRCLPPGRRTAIASPLLMLPGIAPAQADTDVLDALPRRERAALARELLARPGGADVPDVAERLSARLPWPEAKPILAEAIRRPTADERARAYPLLVTAAAGSRDPAVVGELLELLARLRNEQDPVRRAALEAITRLSPDLLTAAHLPGLLQLAEDALRARDRSYYTTQAVSTLNQILLQRGARTGDSAFTEAALAMTGLLAEVSFALHLYGLHRNLPHGAEHRLFESLRPRLEADAARDHWDLTLELAAGLDRRAHGVAGLQRLVLRACTASSDYTVRRAVDLALANPATRDAHLNELLRHDRSVMLLPTVQFIVSQRRTDLLDILLSGKTPGRFLSGKVSFVPVHLGGLDRWTPASLDRYAELLDACARSSKPSIAERAAAVRQLGRVPGSFARILAYTDAADLTLAEAALTALGRSDEPERAGAELARYVTGDRARVAVFSLASCARAVPPDRLGAILTPLLDSPKITAVKEGVRLLATLPAPDAMTRIDRLWQRPDLHRDIRRAAVFGIRGLYRDERAWRLLAEAATDPAVAGALLDISPTTLPVPYRERFAALLRDVAAGDDPRVAAQALAALGNWYRWAPPDTGDVLVARLTDLSELGMWRTALRVLLISLGVSGDHAALTAAVSALRDHDRTLPGRDLPAHQRLSTLAQLLHPVLRNNEVARPAAAAVTALLAADPLWHPQVVDLTLAAVRWTEPEATVATIDGLSGVATGTLLGFPAERLVARLAHDLPALPSEALAPIATGLAARPDIPTVLAAVALIAQCGKHFGWAEPWTTLLTGLRAHADVNVRRAAYAVFTAPE